MRSIVKFISASFIVGFGVLAFGAGAAQADACKSPYLHVQNRNPDPIEIKKFQYLDGCDNKWRTEQVMNHVMEPSEYWVYVDNLQYAGNCPIKGFKFYRAHKSSDGKFKDFSWTGEITPTQGSVCNTDAKFEIQIAE